jgi:hypothetical protein
MAVPALGAAKIGLQEWKRKTHLKYDWYAKNMDITVEIKGEQGYVFCSLVLYCGMNCSFTLS